MSACPRTLADAGRLRCQRKDAHPAQQRGGHLYVAAWAPDGKHDDDDD